MNCRYIQETQENTIREIIEVEEEIKKLGPATVTVNGQIVNIKCTLVMTMIDTKIINVLAESSSQSCYICGCLPIEMNNLNIVKLRPIRKKMLQYGLFTCLD